MVSGQIDGALYNIDGLCIVCFSITTTTTTTTTTTRKNTYYKLTLKINIVNILTIKVILYFILDFLYTHYIIYY